MLVLLFLLWLYHPGKIIFFPLEYDKFFPENKKRTTAY